MSQARNKRTVQPDAEANVVRSGISDADVERMADALELRILRLFRPDPASVPELSARHVDLDDLIGVKEAAAIAGRHEKTIRRWMRDFDISVVAVGTKFISRKKLLAHISHNSGGADDL